MELTKRLGAATVGYKMPSAKQLGKGRGPSCLSHARPLEGVEGAPQPPALLSPMHPCPGATGPIQPTVCVGWGFFKGIARYFPSISLTPPADARRLPL